MSVQRCKKPWGYEEIIENDRYVVKKLFMKEGEQCSCQYHEYKMETIVVLEGTLCIKMGKGTKHYREKFLTPFEWITIEPNEVHRMYGVTDCLYLECSTTELNDVIRLEDDYGRE